MTVTQELIPKAEDIAYVRFQAPDLSLMQAFLTDFGFTVASGETEDGTPALYSRGTDASPYLHVTEQGEAGFLGLGFHMASLADLEALSTFDGASAVHDLEGVSGCKRVRCIDPNGNIVDGLFGFRDRKRDTIRDRLPFNTATKRKRIGKALRLDPGPAKIFRLGHCVLDVYDFRESEAWYKSRFGLITGHEIYVKNKDDILGAFFRCDRGKTPSDHHTLFLIGSGKSAAGHIAFEVNDWDSLMLGHDHLAKKGYNPHWGIGKHLLGSQTFDYWLDPYDNVLEHFTDGDMFDASEPPTLESIETLLGVQWGPKEPVSDVKL